MDQRDENLRLVTDYNLTEAEVELLVRFVANNPLMGLVDEIPGIDGLQKEKLKAYLAGLAGGENVIPLEPKDFIAPNILAGLMRRIIRGSEIVESMEIVGRDDQQITTLRTKARYHLLRAAGVIVEPEE